MKKCKRCNYKWKSRVAAPALCPRCKSPLWHKDYVRRKRVEQWL